MIEPQKFKLVRDYNSGLYSQVPVEEEVEDVEYPEQEEEIITPKVDQPKKKGRPVKNALMTPSVIKKPKKPKKAVKKPGMPKFPKAPKL